MHRGCESKLVFSNSGLVGFATGSDHCTEHECGSEVLLSSLTAKSESEADAIDVLRRGQEPVYPDLLESKRIVKFPQQLQFVIAEGDVPEAILGFAPQSLSECTNELRFIEGSKYQDPHVAGAWDSGSFAIRVRGVGYVQALTAFHEALRAGNVVFAATFLKRNERLGGVIMADLTKLSEDDKAAVKQAQKQFDSQLRLKARSRVVELNQEIVRYIGRGVGHLWPIWSDEAETDVVYGLNPGYGVDAEYYGPYTREQLLAWAKANCSYRLIRERAQQPA
ncbi:hypothetical protein F6X40_35465 [Paraburkholderia sp. UCT31]|uniref:hypothetical protein n=1 Tax=Paraburkholderia sp. UCT31 TaxID=2615209 RepID=UPI0016557B69|nr:hypothetical protein [Paraburkholderia sp. UCT31]MBC8741849.1 hypothetical protein [Paraburkholderia sp. UCT31]